ncbi:MAG TPA: nucleotidyltransferase family protein, partial [Thermoleophilaceae bacterium]|nr:nucleotidyltransferase family protein [Thermoleophilaceae bacterium]
MRTAAFQALAAAAASSCGVAEPRPPVGAIDWEELVRLAGRHRVAGLAHRSGWLDRLGAPEATRAALAERARRASLESLRVLALHREVLDLLGGAGIGALVLKGPAVAIDAYGDPNARAPGDADLLLAREAIPAAVRLLRGAGFDWYGWRPPEDPDRDAAGPDAIDRLEHLPMLRDVTLEKQGLQVELHWRLFPNAALLPVDPRWLAEPRMLEHHGALLPTLPLDAQWTYALVHGTNHLWSILKWLSDVPALCLRHPELARRAALARLDPGHQRAVATGLIVAEAVFGPFLSADSRAWAASVRGTRVLVGRSLAAVTAPHDRSKRVTPRALAGEIAGRLALRA